MGILDIDLSDMPIFLPIFTTAAVWDLLDYAVEFLCYLLSYGV